jgi:hypothetical protein
VRALRPDPSWTANHYLPRRDVAGNNAARPDDRAFADHNPGQDHASSADPGAPADSWETETGSRQSVVERDDPGAHEHIVFDDDASRDVTRRLN